MWCVYARKFNNNRFDVPDFMHVQGVYETTMKTTAYNSISEYIDNKSKRSNTQKGTSVFSEDQHKFDYTEAETESLDVGFSVEAPVAKVEGSYKERL